MLAAAAWAGNLGAADLILGRWSRAGPGSAARGCLAGVHVSVSMRMLEQEALSRDGSVLPRSQHLTLLPPPWWTPKPKNKAPQFHFRFIRRIRQFTRARLFSFVFYFILDNDSTDNLAVEKQYLGIILNSPSKAGLLHFHVWVVGS